MFLAAWLATAAAGRAHLPCVDGLDRTTPAYHPKGPAVGRVFRLRANDPDAVAYLTFWLGDLDGDGQLDPIAQSVTPGVPPHWIAAVTCGDELVLVWKGEAASLEVAEAATPAGARTWRDLTRTGSDGRVERLRFAGTAYAVSAAEQPAPPEVRAP